VGPSSQISGHVPSNGAPTYLGLSTNTRRVGWGEGPGNSPADLLFTTPCYRARVGIKPPAAGCLTSPISSPSAAIFRTALERSTLASIASSYSYTPPVRTSNLGSFGAESSRFGRVQRDRQSERDTRERETRETRETSETRETKRAREENCEVIGIQFRCGSRFSERRESVWYKRERKCVEFWPS
jgi:hypothetical protein